MSAPQEFDARLEGVRVHIRVTGSEAGGGVGVFPILLINGIGAHTAMWACMEEQLRGRRVIAFDAPGTGRSATPLKPVSLARVARIATRVLDAVGVERADVLGYSMGGMVAQQVAADAPHRVRRLALVATTCGLGSVQGDALALLNIATPARYLSRDLYMATIGTLAGGRARNDRDWVARHGELRLLWPPSIRGYINQLVSLTGWTSLRMLERIDHPTLVVTGDDDPLVPVSNAVLLAGTLRHARMFVAPGEGHLLLMDRESLAMKPIRGFLDAEDLERAPAWRTAIEVDEEKLQRVLGRATFQLHPLGLVSALARRRWMPDAPRRSEHDEPAAGGLRRSAA
jgi:pimeloyl-ACP methyl ester carboxylesterase